MDFTRDNKFQDDPVSFDNGKLIGPDGSKMKDVSVDDNKVRDDISKSVLSRVTFTGNFDTRSCFVAGGSSLSLGAKEAFFAADSGTRFTIMTMSTAQNWDGQALAEMKFVGVAGSSFPVFGGDDMIVEIKDLMGTWRRKNFGKAFVSPHANLDLASAFEM